MGGEVLATTTPPLLRNNEAGRACLQAVSQDGVFSRLLGFQGRFGSQIKSERAREFESERRGDGARESERKGETATQRNGGRGGGVGWGGRGSFPGHAVIKGHAIDAATLHGSTHVLHTTTST
jgi:hypothetical protein